jgi:hypothetical protein
MTVTFTLNGYQPDSEDIEPVSTGLGSPEMRPNPVQVELTPAPPPSKPVKKLAPKKKVAVKPAAKPKTSTAPAPAPMTAAPAQQAPAPWPSATPPRQ